MSEQRMITKAQLDQSEAALCKCGSEFFTECIEIRRLSRLVTLTADDQYVPIPAILCRACGTKFEPGRQDKPKLLSSDT